MSMNEKSLKQELQEKIAKIELNKKQPQSKQSVTMEELRKRYENEPQLEQQPELPVKKNKRSASKKQSNKQKNHLGFTKATVLLPDKLQDLLKKKAKADGMDYHDALKILAHRYVAGVIELDAKDAKLIDKYYNGQEF